MLSLAPRTMRSVVSFKNGLPISYKKDTIDRISFASLFLVPFGTWYDVFVRCYNVFLAFLLGQWLIALSLWPPFVFSVFDQGQMWRKHVYFAEQNGLFYTLILGCLCCVLELSPVWACDNISLECLDSLSTYRAVLRIWLKECLWPMLYVWLPFSWMGGVNYLIVLLYWN